MVAGKWVTNEPGELLWLPDDARNNATARLIWAASTQSVSIAWSRAVSLEILQDGVSRLTSVELEREAAIAKADAEDRTAWEDGSVGIFPEGFDERHDEPPTEAEMDREYAREMAAFNSYRFPGIRPTLAEQEIL